MSNFLSFTLAIPEAARAHESHDELEITYATKPDFEGISPICVEANRLLFIFWQFAEWKVQKKQVWPMRERYCHGLA